MNKYFGEYAESMLLYYCIIRIIIFGDTVRTMKSDEIDLRPMNVRKKPRTWAYAIIVMLAYTIEKQLKEKWKDINITVNAKLLFPKKGKIRFPEKGID